MKSAFTRAMRVGRATVFLVGLAVVLALTFGAASTAFAAKAPALKLGVQNTAKAVTSVVGTLAAPILRLDNNGAGPALDLQVEPGQAPMTVNSDTRVDNLNSDRLDGKSSEEFANSQHTHSGSDITSGTVAEARIDGALARDSEVSNGFIQGRGTARHRAVAINPDTNQFFWDISNTPLSLSYNCPADLASNGFIGIKNTSAETVNAFSDNGLDNPFYNQLDPVGSQSHPTGEFWSQGAAAAGEHIIFQVQGTYVATIEVFSVHRTGDNKCHVQAQALVTR